MEKIEMLMKDAAFVQKLIALETNEDVIKLFADNGVTISTKEVEALGDVIALAMSDKEEFDEEELDKVSGGIGWIGVAIIAGLFAAAGKGAQEGMDYVSCEVNDKPFWKHKNQNYCDKYR